MLTNFSWSWLGTPIAQILVPHLNIHLIETKLILAKSNYKQIDDCQIQNDLM